MATASPMPVPPPVINAVLPARFAALFMMRLTSFFPFFIEWTCLGFTPLSRETKVESRCCHRRLNQPRVSTSGHLVGSWDSTLAGGAWLANNLRGVSGTILAN
jgi:hypothetical protein